MSKGIDVTSFRKTLQKQIETLAFVESVSVVFFFLNDIVTIPQSYRDLKKNQE
jgi:hypothetical protein